MIGHHITNLFDEIPRHLIKKERKVFESTLEAIFSSTHLKRGSDNRKALLKLTTSLNGRIDDQYWQILHTLCEIQEILYSQERSTALILRLYNLTFLHAVKMVGCQIDNETKIVRVVLSRFGLSCARAISNYADAFFEC